MGTSRRLPLLFPPPHRYKVTCSCQQGFSDLRFGDIIIVKPMRDYSAKEIAFYNRMFSVPSVFIPSLETKVSSGVGARSFLTPGCWRWSRRFCPADDGEGQHSASDGELRDQTAGGLPLDRQHHLQVFIKPQTPSRKVECCCEDSCRAAFRTSEKLQTAGKGSSTGHQWDRCLLCMCSLDTAVGKFAAEPPSIHV